MTTISARVIAKSVSEAGQEIATVHMHYPLVIHAELMTHRVFSRNARSSRAVPISRMIQDVLDDPFVPLHWGAAQSGMQAYAECDSPVVLETHCPVFELNEEDKSFTSCEPQVIFGFDLSRTKAWMWACEKAIDAARAFEKAGYAKQVANRLLAPFLHIDTLVTSTKWSNFLALRDHHAAEPHIQILAQETRRALNETKATLVRNGEWHLPYITESDLITIVDSVSEEEWEDAPGLRNAVLKKSLKVSAARCARISYAPFDGDGSISSELRRYDLLVGSAPVHASPCEHQATPDVFIDKRAICPQWSRPELHGNLVGWQQFRKMIPGESVD